MPRPPGLSQISGMFVYMVDISVAGAVVEVWVGLCEYYPNIACYVVMNL